jgi:hypothetical protein
MSLPDVTMLSTEELDALRDMVAMERIKRKPEIPMEQPVTMEAVLDPKWYLTLAEQGSYLQMRHPGYGWVGYMIAPASRAALASFLLQHALMPPPKAEAPAPAPATSGGGVVH